MNFFVGGAMFLCALFLLTGCDQIASNLSNPVGSYLKLEKDSTLMLAGETFTISKTTINDNAVYSYISSNEKVATVDQKGVVTAVGQGTAIITVKVAGDDYYQEGTAPFKVKVYDVLSTVKVDEIGQLVCTEGHIHPIDADAECEADRVAMLAYVGNKSNCKYGLAFALKDAGRGSWNVGVAYAATYNEIYAVAGGTWRLPSTDDWQYMFIGCGGTTAYIPSLTDRDKFDCKNFMSKLLDAGGDALNTYIFYWSSSKDADNTANAWQFYNASYDASVGNFESWQTSYTDRVRYCLAF